jgi:hypothetical protein
MPDHRLARCLFCWAVLLAPGCQAFFSYRPVLVQIRDAETKKPIPGAEVHICYPMTRPSVAPWESLEVSDNEGIARLRAAPFGEAGLRLEGAARDYLPESLSVPVEAIAEIPPPSLFLPDGKRPINFSLELYHGPPPSVELVLPKDYRGLVKAEIQVRDDTPYPPGQRRFTYNVDPTGYVLVSGPPLLRKVLTPDFHARYAGGPELSKEPDILEVRFRPLKADLDVQFFAVGNQSEFDALRRIAERVSPEQALTAAGSQGGRPHQRARADNR